MLFLLLFEMVTLFPTSPVFPPGFTYIPDFITEAEEAYLIGEIGKIPLHTFLFQGFEAKRKVASFGYDWSFDKRILSKGAGIPDAFRPLIGAVARGLSLNETAFAELLLTEYPEGSVINWHRDAPPFDLIAGMSLLADCTFRLRPHDKARQGRGAVISLPVRRRSLYVIQGEARIDWQHSIAAVKERRYSITLRTLREPLRS
jgi:alkylated DNA repair dioxygenase AlkB